MINKLHIRIPKYKKISNLGNMLIMFLVFEKQDVTEYTISCDYRSSRYYLTNNITTANWLYWKKHSAVEHLSACDLIAYQTNINIPFFKKEIQKFGTITLSKFYSFLNNRYTTILTNPKQNKNSIAQL